MYTRNRDSERSMINATIRERRLQTRFDYGYWNVILLLGKVINAPFVRYMYIGLILWSFSFVVVFSFARAKGDGEIYSLWLSIHSLFCLHGSMVNHGLPLPNVWTTTMGNFVDAQLAKINEIIKWLCEYWKSAVPLLGDTQYIPRYYARVQSPFAINGIWNLYTHFINNYVILIF